MANITEESLKSALTDLGLTQIGLPKMWRGEQDGFWIKALALVRKLNGDLSYYAVERNAEGLISYKTDYGRMSPIRERVRIHPYMFLDEARYVNVGDEKDRRYHLFTVTEEEEEKSKVMTMSDEEVILKLRERGIRLQLESDESDLAATKIVEYDDAEDATPSVADDEQGEIERMMLEADVQREREKEETTEKTAEVEAEEKTTSTHKKAPVAKKKKAATAKPKRRAAKS